MRALPSKLDTGYTSARRGCEAQAARSIAIRIVCSITPISCAGFEFGQEERAYRPIYNLFNVQRHLISRRALTTFRDQAMEE